MSVFALENGRLVPAQAVSTSDAGVTAESMAAIRERVIELLDVPLFPVAWQSEPASDGSRESLIALDPTGQTVTVEVIDYLDADELLGSLARAGRHGEMSRSSLALIYGPGARSFPRDWRLFLDACPPHPAPGPRLYLVVLGIDDTVRAAVDALAGGGLDVRRASLHDGGSQVLVSFEQLRPQPGRLGAILSSAQHYNEQLLDAPAEASGPEELPLAAEVTKLDESPAPQETATPEAIAETVPEPAPDPIEPEQEVEPEAVSGEIVGEEAAGPALPENWGSGGNASSQELVDDPEPVAGQPEPAVEESVTPSESIEVSAEQVTEHPEQPEPVQSQVAQNAPEKQDKPETDVLEEPEELSTEAQIDQLRSMLAGEESEAPVQEKKPRRSHSRRSQVSRDKPATESGPERPVRLDRPERGAAPSAFANVPGYTGPTAFAQSTDASGSRREQDLWENSAPVHGGRPVPQTISESSAATFSSEAVQQAADHDHVGTPSRLIQIAQRYGAPFSVVWSQRRRNISLSARVTAWGTIVLPDGRVYTDPSEAASAASGIAGVDGWSVWRVPGGKRLGEL